MALKTEFKIYTFYYIVELPRSVEAQGSLRSTDLKWLTKPTTK